MGLSRHSRVGYSGTVPSRVSHVSGEEIAAKGGAQRGGSGKSKTTRSQRTNLTYKRHINGRPSIDDVEKISHGKKTKAMGVAEREAPYRLSQVQREAWERAKTRGVLEIQTTQASSVDTRRHPLVRSCSLNRPGSKRGLKALGFSAWLKAPETHKQ